MGSIWCRGDVVHSPLLQHMKPGEVILAGTWEGQEKSFLLKRILLLYYLWKYVKCAEEISVLKWGEINLGQGVRKVLGSQKRDGISAEEGFRRKLKQALKCCRVMATK